ncbi:MAG TPA: hypothetical protein VJ953_13660 [Saprospiraceae bacterium]|nr:hypothetical protein [Saprospiraceae bacterium]
MKIQKFLLIIMVFFAFALSTEGLHAQGATYNTAVGLRLGYPLSASLKKFVGEDLAAEAYVGFRGFSGYSWVNIAAALQKHAPIEDIDGLQWYYGGGATVLFYSYDFGFDGGSNTGIGLQGYLGLDYKFDDVPLSVTLDWIPTLFISGFTNGFGAGYGSLGVRYTLD